MLNCFGPTCGILAKRVIENISEEDDFLKIKIKNHDSFLYYHKSLLLHMLYQTLAEQFYKWQWHYYQIPQTQITPEDIVFDCGCAEGVFSFINAKNAKHIYCFEPLSEYLNGLYKTFSDYKNISIINSALGDKTGQAYLMKSGINSFVTSESTGEKVKIDTIDYFCSTNKLGVNYIKADLEGSEMNLLQGASETIKKNRPKIAITTYHEESHAYQIREFLTTIIPSYKILVKGITTPKGSPLMLHAW
jgi:FkbM family methyltransferase